MKNLKLISTFILGSIMILGGVMHFFMTELYLPFLPLFLPREALIYLSGILEISLGIGVFIPRLRFYATFGILLMMLLFLPLHIIDIFKQNPAIGSHQLALIRLPLQFILIFWAWYIHKK